MVVRERPALVNTLLRRTVNRVVGLKESAARCDQDAERLFDPTHAKSELALER